MNVGRIRQKPLNKICIGFYFKYDCTLTQNLMSWCTGEIKCCQKFLVLIDMLWKAFYFSMIFSVVRLLWVRKISRIGQHNWENNQCQGQVLSPLSELLITTHHIMMRRPKQFLANGRTTYQVSVLCRDMKYRTQTSSFRAGWVIQVLQPTFTY